MPKYFKPNECEIGLIELVNFAGASFDITNVFTRVEIEEDIFSSSLMGRLTISESQDFQQNFPLIGEERFRIKFRTHDDMKWRELEFYCYGAADKMPVGQKICYTLHFTSEEYLSSRSKRLSAPIVAQPAEKVIENMLKNDLGSKKKLISSKTADPITFIPTYIHPFELASSLMSRSRGAKYGDYGFVFFESTDGFHFQSIDELISETPVDYTFNNRAGVLQVEDTLHTINKHQVDEVHNILDRIVNGSYGTETIVFDPLKRKATSSRFDYFDDKDYGALNNTAGQSPTKRMQTTTFPFKEAEQRMVIVDNGVRSAGRGARYARLNWLDCGFKMRVEIPGNSELRVGDTINAKWPSQDGNDIEQKHAPDDRFVAGKYLNISMMHIIEKDSTPKYTQSCEWVRDSFERGHEEEFKKMNKRLA